MFRKLFGFGKKDKDKEKEKNSTKKFEVNKKDLEASSLHDHELHGEGVNHINIDEEKIKKEKVKDEEIFSDLEYEVKELKTEHIEDEYFDKIENELQKNKFQIEEEHTLNNNVQESFNTPEVHEEKPNKKGFFDRLKEGLFKTRDAMNSAFDNLINGKATIDDELYDELEEILISADIGVETTMKVIDELRDVVAKKHIRNTKDIKVELEEILKNNLKLKNKDNELNIYNGKPSIVLVIGVNGVGKTTTIGKLAYNLQKEGKRVMLAAADTFRAAAIEQLTEWSRRVNVEIVSHNEGADPASVVYDAIKSQKSSNKDVLIIDTAGRLHNKKNLMNELEKINRIIDREHADANKETLLVLDATTGQNAVYQAKEFNKVTNITGIVLTKLDGTAKGGVVFPLQVEHNIPIKYIGIGEQKENLEKFDSEKFIDALFTSK